jgi:hypothetical protein
MTTSDWHRGGTLTAAEQVMCRRSEVGELVDGGGGPFNLAAMQAWGPGRTVRASVLRHLLVADEWPVHERGVRLRGLRISGQLDLGNASLRCLLLLDSCHVPEPVTLTGTTASLLVLNRCHVAGLVGDMLVVKYLDMSGSTFAGPLRLALADIAGGLSCRSCHLSNPGQDGNVLFAERMKVGGDVLLDMPPGQGRFTAEGNIHLVGASIAGNLSCVGARLTVASQGLNSLNAERLKVGGDVFLNSHPGQSGFSAQGTVRLVAADIAGVLDCSGASLGGQGGDALVGAGMKVGGGVLLGAGFTAAGAIDLRGADITRNLDCRGGAQLNGVNRQGNALHADRTTVGGHVLLNKGFTAAGALYLVDANIAGNVECRGAQLNGANRAGNALQAERMKVGGDVYLDTPAGKNGFRAEGTIYLLGADVGGVLSCRGANLTAPGRDGNALFAERMKVGGNVYLTEGFSAAGNVKLRAATIGGSLAIAPSRLADDKTKSALDATEVRVTGRLRWAPEKQVLGHVSLEGAAVGQLEDSWTEPDGSKRPNGYWPTSGRLRLDGLTYGSIIGENQPDVDQRLKWVQSQYRPKAKDFVSQPYRQLVQAYQQVGKDTEARKVAIAQLRDLRKHGHLTWHRNIFNRLLDLFIGYGYQTWKAGIYLLILFGAVFAFVLVAKGHSAIVPAQNTALVYPTPTAVRCQSNYPCFEPFGYTIDTVIPLINVHQADYWGPNADGPWGWACVVITYLGTAFGWLLATLALAGATGIVRKIDLS